MALSPYLTDKNLPRFRTKPCERLVAGGKCNFGDRCQYSHAAMPRRNPKKTKYSADFCPFRVDGPQRSGPCRNGDQCRLSHTNEERLYHPEFYKTRQCELGASCKEYYCPYAHSRDEMRTFKVVLEPGEVTRAESESSEAHDVGPVAPEGWWFVGDQKDLLVSKGEVLRDFFGLGHQITGGYVRQAQILPERNQGPPRHCVARLLSTSRGDSAVANRVIKDIRRWMSLCCTPALLIRRTVATTVLALSPDLCCLDTLMKGPSSPFQRIKEDWSQISMLAKWFSQITLEVQKLHSTLNIAHMCLGPCTIFLDRQTQQPQLGDFLGKVQYLRYAQSGFSSRDDEWAMWYPAEVHKQMAQGGTLVPGSNNTREDAEDLDEYLVDAWQLGMVAFFMLTGVHPFGPWDQPTVVSGNITSHRVVNWTLMEDFPLWADLIGRLLSHDPKDRLRVEDVMKHPLFWTFAEVSDLASTLMEQTGSYARLYHLPCYCRFAPGRAVPPAPPAQMCLKICGEALKGKKPKELVYLVQNGINGTSTPPLQLQNPWQITAFRDLLDAFEAGKAAGAAGVFASVLPPPGLGWWPPPPWPEVNKVKVPPISGSGTMPFGQEMPACPPWTVPAAMSCALQGLPEPWHLPTDHFDPAEWPLMLPNSTLPETDATQGPPCFDDEYQERHVPSTKQGLVPDVSSFFSSPAGTNGETGSVPDCSSFFSSPAKGTTGETGVCDITPEPVDRPRSLSPEEKQQRRKVKEMLGVCLQKLAELDEAMEAERKPPPVDGHQ